MIVLSLFDGISAGQIALNRACINISKYYASEIDKYAIKVTQSNYPNTIQLGDIQNWRNWNIEWSQVGMLIGGSPCQSFSVAGSGAGFEGKSGLIEYYFEIKEHIQAQNKDVIFLLENVQMKSEWKNAISNRLGVEPILINSALVSAQNRNRLYWTNIPNINQPEDKQIMLKDIIENGEAIKEKSQTILSTLYKENAKSMLKRNKSGLLVVDRDKAFCLDANYWKGTNIEQYLKKHRRQIVFTSEGFRKLTPLECERLQTFPDNYTGILSNMQRYKALGNSWTVDVIAHIFSYLKQ
jgi:DNA-cytosine methyltransferase